MSKKLRRFLLVGSFLLLASCLPEFASAGPSGGGPPTGTPPCWPPPCVPIDGGISVLVAAGLAYGGKKLFDSRK